jgi:phage terminase small subunit
MPGTRNSGGHNRKSTSLHLLQRSYRADRHGNRETPDVPSGRPEKPATLTGEAAEEWDRTIVRLQIMETLTQVDDAVVYHYCCLFAETEILRRQLETVEGEALVALIGKLGNARNKIRQYLVELGLTPSARTRVKALGTKSGAPTPQEKLRAKFFGSGKTPA